MPSTRVLDCRFVRRPDRRKSEEKKKNPLQEHLTIEVEVDWEGQRGVTMSHSRE